MLFCITYTKFTAKFICKRKYYVQSIYASGIYIQSRIMRMQATKGFYLS